MILNFIQRQPLVGGTLAESIREAMNQRQVEALPPLKIRSVGRTSRMCLDQQRQYSMRCKVPMGKMLVNSLAVCSLVDLIAARRESTRHTMLSVMLRPKECAIGHPRRFDTVGVVGIVAIPIMLVYDYLRANSSRGSRDCGCLRL